MADDTFRLSPQAMVDLEDIWAYTAERWSSDQAKIYHANLVAAFEGLADGRKRGRPVSIREGYLKYAVGGHLVFYRTTGARIDVMRILHQRMDIDDHL